MINAPPSNFRPRLSPPARFCARRRARTVIKKYLSIRCRYNSVRIASTIKHRSHFDNPAWQRGGGVSRKKCRISADNSAYRRKRRKREKNTGEEDKIPRKISIRRSARSLISAYARDRSNYTRARRERQRRRTRRDKGTEGGRERAPR